MPLGIGAILALAGTAGTAATNIYATKRAGKINDRSIDAQSAEARRQQELDRYAIDQQREIARLDREQAERARQAEVQYRENARQEALAFEESRWTDYNNQYNAWLGGPVSNLANTSGMSMPRGMGPGAAPPRGMPSGQLTGTHPPASGWREDPSNGRADQTLTSFGGRTPSRGREIAARVAMPTPVAGMTPQEIMDLSRIGRTTRPPNYGHRDTDYTGR